MRKQDSFKFNIRTQFTFIASDRTLANILSEIAEKNVNITGYFQTKLKHDNFVRLVPGTVDAETELDLCIVRNVLKSHRVRFIEQEVIQILEIIPGTPGIASSIINALLGKVTVKALYFGEETTLFLSVSNIKKAIEILSEL